MRGRVPLVLLAAAAPMLVVANPARADSSAADKAAAQELFDQGRRLLDAGQYAEACAKFEASQRLDPGAGTLLNLATCNERIGRTASAWTEFNEALSLAIRDGRRDRISYAREHIAAIEPQLPHLTVRVRAPDISGLRVSIDGAALGQAAWGLAAPMDPGEHVIEASAPGRLPFKTTVKIAPTETSMVEVPALVEDPRAAVRQPAALPEAVRPAPPENAARRIAGEIALGAGAVVIGAGTYFGIRAMSLWSEANANCQSDICNSLGVQRTQDARSWAHAADVAIGVGIAALGAGAVLMLTSSSAAGRSPSAGVRLAPTAGGGGLSLDGAW